MPTDTPITVGSPKQIEWATRIRADALTWQHELDLLAERINRTAPQHSEEHANAIRSAFNCEDARVWIDNRDYLPPRPNVACGEEWIVVGMADYVRTAEALGIGLGRMIGGRYEEALAPLLKSVAAEYRRKIQDA